MNNFRVETYNNPNNFYKEINHTADSLHIVATSALSMHLKSVKGLNEHKNHVWTYANLQKAIYREWHAVINQVKIKIEIRSILEQICGEEKSYRYLLNDLDAILSDYKFYIESGISILDDREYLSSQIKIVRKAFNIFTNSSLVKETYYNYERFNKADVTTRLNKYYKEVLFSKASREEKVEPETIANINKIYVYNLTHIDATRFNFFRKLSKLGIEIIFRIPYEGFHKPWEKTYKFIDKNNWSEAFPGPQNYTLQNKYTAYLNGDFDIQDNKNKNISFKGYVDPYEFKLKLQQYPIFQNNLELIKWREINNYVHDIEILKNGIEYKREREYLTFSKETYNDIFNGTILNYVDKRNNFFNFNEGRFLRGIYNCSCDENGSTILLDYNSYCDCISSGWIELKNKSSVISGKDASDLLIDLKPYMNGIESIDDIMNRLNRLTYLQEFSINFDNLSKEKTEGDRVKEYLHNPLKVISYVDNGRYEVTVKQLIELTKRLKKYLEELLPMGNRIDIKVHKEQLIQYWRSISYVCKVREEDTQMYNQFKANNDSKLKNKIINFQKINLHYLSFERNLKRSIDIETLCTISEVKQYMRVVLKMSKGDDEDDSEISDYNYIKLFDQIEGIMVNGTKEIYVTDLSEKSINKYVKSRKGTTNYSDEVTLKKDIESLNNIYSIEEINAVIQQITISDEEIIGFVKYYIGALISFSKAKKIEFSWIKEINNNDQESTIYKILSTLYGNKDERIMYFNNKDRLLIKYNENKNKLSSFKNNLKSLYEINQILNKDTNMEFHKDIAPTAWLDLDLCPSKFFYSGILSFYPVYESDFHQRIVFSIVGKLLKSQFENSKDVERYFYYLFPQWNRTMKDNFVDTSYRRDIRREYKFKNIYFPYHIKDIQTLRSKIYDNARRKRRNAYREMAINSVKYMKEFIKEDAKYDTVRVSKGAHCDMCPHNMICCKGEFAIERSNY